MSAAFTSEKVVTKPRKAKRCTWCAEVCEVGAPRVNWAGYGEDFWHAVTHTECAAAVHRFYAANESESWDDSWPEEPCKRGKTWRESHEPKDVEMCDTMRGIRKEAQS
jgi:hypothetical protein